MTRFSGWRLFVGTSSAPSSAAIARHNTGISNGTPCATSSPAPGSLAKVRERRLTWMSGLRRDVAELSAEKVAYTLAVRAQQQDLELAVRVDPGSQRGDRRSAPALAFV